MASKPPAKTTAQRAQVPPEIRQFVQDQCRGVDGIERFGKENESVRRGWTVTASRVNTGRIPDGYESAVVRVDNEGQARVQVVETLPWE